MQQLRCLTIIMLAFCLLGGVLMAQGKQDKLPPAPRPRVLPKPTPKPKRTGKMERSDWLAILKEHNDELTRLCGGPMWEPVLCVTFGKLESNTIPTAAEDLAFMKALVEEELLKEDGMDDNEYGTYYYFAVANDRNKTGVYDGVDKRYRRAR